MSRRSLGVALAGSAVVLVAYYWPNLGSPVGSPPAASSVRQEAALRLPTSAPRRPAKTVNAAPSLSKAKPPIPAPSPAATDQEVYGKPVSTLVAGWQDGRWVTQGDILVDESHLVSGVGDENVRIASLDGVQYWQHGVVPYTIDANLDAAPVLAAIAMIESGAQVRFIPHTDEADYVVFRDTDADICQSYLGRKGGEQEVLLHHCKQGQILHELMHLMGFVHEQSREDRDRYVRIAWTEIQPAYKNQFQKVPAAISNPAHVPFDFGSILMYPSNAFSQTGRPTMVKLDGSAFTANRGSLSALDKEKLVRLYGKASPDRRPDTGA